MPRYKIRVQGKPLVDQMVLGGKVPLRKALERRYRPSTQLLRAIGTEIVHGFQGAARLTSAHVDKKSRLTVRKTGIYPYGILRKRSPTGAAYTELAKSTIALKKRLGSGWAEHPLRERPLANTGALINQLRIRVYANRDGVDVRFRDAEMNKRSLMHEEGRLRHASVPNPADPDIWLEKKKGGEGTGKPQYSPLPARPHRGVQPAVGESIRKLLRAWVHR